MRGPRYIASVENPILVETSTTDTPMKNKRTVTYYNERKYSREGELRQFMMHLSEKCDNKREDKHTACRHAPRIHPHVAPGSLFHHRCATKLHQCRHLGSGEEHRPYSAHHPQTHRDGGAPHKRYSAQRLRGLSDSGYHSDQIMKYPQSWLQQG